MHRPPHSTWFDHPNNILLGVKVMKVWITPFAQYMFWNNLVLCFSVSVTDQVSHPYKITDRIIVLFLILYISRAVNVKWIHATVLIYGYVLPSNFYFAMYQWPYYMLTVRNLCVRSDRKFWAQWYFSLRRFKQTSFLLLNPTDWVLVQMFLS
jgi:hypothetical protein